MVYNTDASRWRALATRDANANGHFIYSVKSTNIYCRPTCPARLARRANVGFYKTPLEAEADGFRACKRCKPNIILEDPQEQAVEKARMLIEEAIKEENPKALRLQDLARKVGLTPRYFHKIFKDKTGLTPKEWAKAKASATPQSSSSTTPTLEASPVGSTEDHIFDWGSFDVNNINELVDFDMDGSATLGYNLATGAAEPISMGYGNAIDVNILHELWTLGGEFECVDTTSFLSGENLVSDLGEISANALIWPAGKKPAQAMSTFEPDANALLSCDSVLF
ncbi:metal binding domain of Ada-domain-containing protein [Phaeosphaeriaceae sp. PMI808]|nr:metal binding domain of Ada-domain-containing protein [Phaeosphaeriaceae sp. PMI808]